MKMVDIKKKVAKKKVTKKVTKKKVAKKVNGRPTKYRTKYDTMLVDHMSHGLSYETFGNLIDTSMSVIYNWESKHPSFKDAKKKAFSKSMEFWEQKGMEGMINSRNFSAAMWIFNMKNRFGWTDKKEVSVDATEEAKKAFGFDLNEKPKD